MLGLSANLNYYLFNGNVDLRKGIFRLCESIRVEMSLDPSDASNVYMFMSRNRKVVKNLHYERGFYVLYEKRPVMGRFKKPVFQLERIHSAHFYQYIFYAMGRYCYNGNISGIAWTSDDEKFSRVYSFYYDGMSRLWSASYSQSDGGVADFSTSYNYDKMGNHTEIFRRGLVMKPDFYEYMDRLSLTYDGNHLKRVTDNGSDPLYSGSYGFVDGANLPIEYIYDKNGNLTQDYNKGIALIQYNSLNLPDTLQFSNGNAIYYVYGADGVKHRVVHQTAIPNLTVPMGSTFTPMAYQISSKTTTDYCGNVIYTDGMPDMLLTEVGYMKIRGTTYHYYLKDHQGNNRILIDQEGNVEQINQYYPFGGLFCDGVADGEHPYRYNGKEIDRMHGLDWYDYGSRMKTDLGFSTLDPLCEKYYSISPYVYCMNNPMRFIDPDGKQVIIPPTLWGLNTPLLGSNSSVLLSSNKPVRIQLEKHHIIPRELKGDPLIKQARKGGFRFEGKENKITVEKFSRASGKGQHGNHPNYTKQIGEKLNNYKKYNYNPTPEQAANFAKKITQSIVEQILNNPGIKINDLQLKTISLPQDNINVLLPIIKIDSKIHLDYIH